MKYPKLLLAITCFSVGIALAATVLWLKALSRESQNNASNEPPLEAGWWDEPIEDESPVTLASIDQAVSDERYDWAAEQYPLLADIGDSDEIVLRTAMALEGGGNRKVALVHYSRLTERASDVIIRNCARIGTARCLIQEGDHRAAEKSLWQVILQQASLQQANFVVAEANHMLAQSYANRYLAIDPIRLLDLGTPAPYAAPFHVGRFFRTVTQFLDSPQRIPPSNLDKKAFHLEVRQSDLGEPAISQYYFDATIGRISILALAKLVGERVGREVMLNQRAHDALRHHSIELNIRDIEGSRLFDGLLAPFGLVWQENEGKIYIFDPSDRSEFDSRSFQHRRAFSLLQDCVLGYPDHALTPVSQHALANMLSISNDYQGASAIYLEILRGRPPSAFRQAIKFNLAKSQVHLSQANEAHRSFFEAVDNPSGRDLSIASLLILAKLAVESGEIEAAIRHSSLAISYVNSDSGDETPFGELAAIFNACGYLLVNDPYSCNRSLSENEKLLKSERIEALASMLSALARFRIQKSKGETGDTAELVRSLTHLDPFYRDVSFVHLPIAEAQYELGFHGEAVQSLRKGLGLTPTSNIRDRMATRLSDILIEKNRADEVVEMMANLPRSGSQQTHNERMVRLAKIQSERGEFEESLETCQQIIQSSPREETVVTVLKIMGGIHEQRGDHYKAALCFAGIVPSPSRTTNQ